MAKSLSKPEVLEHINKAKKWRDEMNELRSILLDSQLTEGLKWRSPCYTYGKSNVAIIGSFKEYCSLSFFKGVLIKDTERILCKPGENTQSARLIRFTSIQQIIGLKSVIRAYIAQAIEIEKSGLQVEFKNQAEPIPDELQKIFREQKTFKAAFQALTPGRQRAYILFFAAAKQSRTRVARIEKYMQRILDGVGLNDCTCGLSKKKPQCDGSHKNIESDSE